MPDEPKPENEAQNAISTEVLEALKEQSAASKALAESVAQAVAKPDDKGSDTAALQQQAQKVQEDALDEYARLQEEGKFKEAAKVYSDGLTKAQQILAKAQTAPDISKDPAFVSLRESAVDRAKRADAAIFEQYGDEILARVATLPPGEQVTDAGVASAVRAIKSEHFDDILQARVAAEREKAVSELGERGIPQHAPDTSLGERPDEELHGLDHEERTFSRALAVPYKDYAAAKKNEDTPNKDGSIPILRDLGLNDTVEPGRF